MSMNDKKIPICKRCGRRLKTQEAIDLGMGKVCWKKSQQYNKSKALFSIEKEISNATNSTRVPK